MIDKLNKAASEHLFLTEILNDLHRNGFIRGGKAETMLVDLRSEHTRKMNFPKTQQKRVHAKHVGAYNW